MNKPLKIMLIVLGVVVLSVVLIVGLGAFWIFTATNVAVTEADKHLVVRAADLVPYFDDYAPSEKFETLEKLRYVDRSEELSYEYDSPNDGDPYIFVSITHDKSRSDSNSTYALDWSAQQLGLNMADGDIDLVENSTFYSRGDRSRFADIKFGELTVGHLFVAQKGKSVYTFSITGFIMDDPEVWQALFNDRIANLEAK